MINLFSKIIKNGTLEDKLKESELRYRRLFESAKDGILILDFESGEIVDANPFILAIIGSPFNEVIGKKLWEIGLFKNKLQSKLAFLELKTSGYVRFEDMPIQRPSGKTTEVEFVSNVYFVNNERVIQCNIRDITERKQLEKRQELINKILIILNNQDDWKLLIRKILVEILTFTGMDETGIRLAESNEDSKCSIAKGFPDLTKTENYLCLRNKKDEIIFHEEKISYLKCMHSIVIAGQTDPSLPFFTKGGSFFSNDISEFFAVNVEKENKSSSFKRCNTGGYESIALIPLYSGNKIIGLLQLNDKRTNMLTLEMIRFFEKLGNSVGIAFNRIQNEIKIIESEQRLKKQNEDYFYLNQKYSVLNQELTTSLDHIQNINVELLVEKAKAEESDKLKSSFLANMSHEIHTPMNSIMGFSDLLLKPGLSKAKLTRFTQIINSSSKQLMAIISDLVDISKIEADQIRIHSEWIDIHNMLNELFVIYKKRIDSQNVSLHYINQGINKGIEVKTDGSRIRQVLCNLLNNAIKFTKQGTIEFGYKIVETVEHTFMQFYVKDTGIGIAPENQKLIFDRFRQVETVNSLKYGGNGLGLSISKALVQKLGGTLKVDSVLGQGSTFSFTIPYFKETKNIVSPEPKAMDNGFNWPQKTILVVEDEINSFTYIEELLADTNVKILHAYNGKQALENIKKDSEISLVLMDMKLPVMDGFEATQLIKQIRPKLPVIAQTAFAHSNERINAYEAGCDNYLTKPIEKEIFMQVIGNYLC